MKLDPAANIWSIDLRLLSDRDKAKIFAQRAEQIVAEVSAKRCVIPNLIASGRIRRGAFAAAIGCERSALRKNPRIVTLMAEFEGRGGDPSSQSVRVEPKAPELPLIVSELMERLAEGAAISGRGREDFIVLTDKTCRISDISLNVPTIIWKDGVDEAGSDWLRYQMISRGVNPSSAYQYAKVLRSFLRECRASGREWFLVDDGFLTEWRNRRREVVDDDTVNYELSLVFDFYAWAERQNLLSYHVGVYEERELPQGMKRAEFPITARRTKSNKSGRNYHGWASTLTFRTSRSGVGRRNTPNDQQVRAVHENLLKNDHGARDTLIAAWAEETGGRRFELLQIKTSDIPSDDEIYRLVVSEEKAEIEVSRKRGRKVPLSAGPHLLLETREWIQGGRQQIVTRMRRDQVGYTDPGDLFLSSKTGKVLHLDSVTKIFGSAFKSAGVAKASLHRLRAKAIVEEIEHLVDSFFELGIVVQPGTDWAETVLTMVAEKAAHASALSLRPYLNFILSRKLSQTDSARRQRVDERARHAERRLSAAEAELTQLLALAQKLSSSPDVEADCKAGLKRLISKFQR